MKHLKQNTARRRQALLAALLLAIVLPSVACAALTVRQNRLQRRLADAHAEIDRLSLALQDAQAEPPDNVSEERPPEHEPPASVSGQAAPAYQSLHPDVYSDTPVGDQTVYENVCYLTFDDGPSEQTPAILDILDRYGVKATFFVVGSSVQKYPDIVKEAAARGHVIGVHTDSHVYKDIYASVESYLDDFSAAWQRVYDLTGQKPAVFRFPGGSINQYNKGIYQPLIAEMLRRGFAYYDWNASAEDAVGKPTAESVVQNALSVQSKMPIVLMHDGTYTTATAEGLPKIIEGFQSRGYTFGVLTPDVYSVAFGYRD